MPVVARQQRRANKIALWSNNATSAEEFGPIGLSAEAWIGTSCSKLMEIVAMKKSLLALVVLGAFAGVASAQSSVTIFGKIDQAVGKRIGFKDKQVLDTAGSRIAFRGYEDLGGGLGALWAIEHRFTPDTGTVGPGVQPSSAASTKFWEGFSFVGLRTQFGAVTLGRQYTSSFLTVQNNVDPFAGETVAALRDIGMGLRTSLTGFETLPVQLNPGQIRVSDSIKYALVAGGVSFSADIAETPAGGSDRPYSVALAYTGGPFWAGVAYENPTSDDDNLLNLGARYTFSNVTLSGAYSFGDTARLGPLGPREIKTWLVGANIAVGVGDIKVGYADAKIGSVKSNERFGIGYHHNLSKRTKIYVDYAYDSKGFHGIASTAPFSASPALRDFRDEKSGYDFGIQHNF